MADLAALEAAAEARDAELDRLEFNDPREQARLQDEADLREEYSRPEYHEDYEPEDDGDDDD